MDITTTPDIYSPGIDDAGNYIDHIPIIHNGLLCLCGTRKDKRYETTNKFAAHIKSKTHQKWLQSLNNNKSNYYVETLKNKELIENQRIIIGQLENTLSKKNLTIDYLTEQLVSKNIQPVTSVNLLDLN